MLSLTLVGADDLAERLGGLPAVIAAVIAAGPASGASQLPDFARRKALAEVVGGRDRDAAIRGAVTAPGDILAARDGAQRDGALADASAGPLQALIAAALDAVRQQMEA
jgi:hypothetical protein